ncbi:MAG: 4Fe-4S dicluster domain-containing protein [Fidelibacterota bacterium]|nr:MAG: 4Fe-4S dicluster domain-containing protein [Candidatus Neomarinimicrobiota bacterium]
MINHSDTTHAIYDIQRTEYWDSRSLDQELDRIYDICIGCRLCWNLCPSFPALFNAIDEQAQRKREAAEQAGRIGAREERTEFLDLPEGEHAVEASAEVEFVGDVTELTEAEKWRVVDLCYQCKLCDPICPYTPDKEHEFQLDFPRLMLRAQAVRTRDRGKKLNDIFLSSTDATGRVGTRLAPLTNWVNRIGIVRWLMEKIVGISRRRTLPAFHRETFEKWYRKHRRAVPVPTNPLGKAAVFATCYTNANDPQVGIAAVEVLEHNNVEVQIASLRCCGAPHLSPGDFQAFRKQALPVVEELAKWVDQGYQIVVTGPPTCSLTIRQDYAYLSNGDAALAEKIANVAANTLDISQYLMQLHKEEKLKTDFATELGEINYHLPCHLKAQKSGYKSRDLLRLVPGTKVNMVDKCSGMDGGWGMKAEFFTESMKMADKLVDTLNRKSAAYTCSDCTLAGMQIHQASHSEIAPIHPIRLIHRAYGLDKQMENHES